MQALEYLVVISALLFSLTFFWLLSVSGVFDCLKTSPIKSAYHCLSLITAQCDQAIANSSRKLSKRQRTEDLSTTNSNQLVPYTV